MFVFFSNSKEDTTPDADAVSVADFNEPSSPMAPDSPVSAVRPQKSLKRSHDEASKDDEDCNFVKTIEIKVGKGEDMRPFDTHRGWLVSKSRYFRERLIKDPDRTEFVFDTEDPKVFHRIQEWLYTGDVLLPSEKRNEEHEVPDLSQVTEDDQREDVPHEDMMFEVCHRDGSITHEKALSAGEFNDHDTSDYDDSNDSQLSDDLATSQTQPLPKDPLDALTLTQVYAFAEVLGMPRLCNKVIDLLGQRLGKDMSTPSDALRYAYEHGQPKTSYLRGLLVDFTARAAPIHDLVAKSIPSQLPPQLMFDLIKKIPSVRGDEQLDSEAWAEHFEAEKSSYHVPLGRVGVGTSKVRRARLSNGRV